MGNLYSFLETKFSRTPDKKYSLKEFANDILNFLKTDKKNYFDTTGFAKDFFLSATLTQSEKKAFYKELKKQGFFQFLNDFLYSDNFSICSWTIYTIGKFSDNENTSYLETAYEANYRIANPMLSYRCLNELSWLSSKKTGQYLSALERDNSIVSKLILLYYWETSSDNSKFKELLTDKELINFIVPNQTSANIEEEVCERLFAFENHISELYNSNENGIDKNEFESIAKNYFKTFTKIIDIEAGKEHHEFLKQLGEG